MTVKKIDPQTTTPEGSSGESDGKETPEVKVETDSTEPKVDPEPEPDTKNYSPAETSDYIKKIQDENAKRRIAEKKAKAESDKAKADADAAAKKLADIQKRLEVFEADKKKKADADKTELERAKADAEAAQAKADEISKKLLEREQELELAKKRTVISDREKFITNLAAKHNFQFRSEFEQSGFINAMTQISEDGSFELIDEEIILKFDDFRAAAGIVKDNPSSPSPRPTKATTGLSEQIKTLTSKRRLTNDEAKELDVLTQKLREQMGQ